ncbi:MAG: segregation/condensation protein A [Candidatus Micrarchaeia archaeon]
MPGEPSAAATSAENFDLERLVAQPTWREVLLDLVVKEQLDPWNIDLALISDKYLQRLRGMQLLDLRIPANIILAAAILLRFKGEALRLKEEEQVAEPETFIEGESSLEIPMLSLRARIPPKRRVTLPELIAALESVLERQRAKEKAPLISPAEPLVIELPQQNLEQQMSDILKRLGELADAENVVAFSALLHERTPLEIINTLIPLLHLSQEGRVSLVQEPLFSEIFIHVLSGEHGRKARGKRVAG